MYTNTNEFNDLYYNARKIRYNINLHNVESIFLSLYRKSFLYDLFSC